MLHLSKKVQERLSKKLELTGEAVVTVGDSGQPRVWALGEYLRRKEISRETIQKSKPWEKTEKPVLGPIGSRSLGPDKSTYSRSEIYDDL